MKKYLRFLAAVVGAGVVTSLQAAATYNNDLIIGFTDLINNDKAYDLGSAASITNGQRWNLSTLLTGYNLNNVSWGIVGTATVGTNRTAWITTGGLPPTLISGLSAWSKVNTAVSSIYSLFPVAGVGQSASANPGDDNSWNQQTIYGSIASQYHNVYQDPNSVGPTCASFYRVVSPNLPPVFLGTFCLAANGVVTFTVATSAPPPPTLSISRAGSVSTISFLGSNTVTYSLAYTNSSGLTAPASSWPTMAGTIRGNNTVTNFTDTTATSNRFYRVRAQ
jgi:hypothetical protein